MNEVGEGPIYTSVKALQYKGLDGPLRKDKRVVDATEKG